MHFPCIRLALTGLSLIGLVAAQSTTVLGIPTSSASLVAPTSSLHVSSLSSVQVSISSQASGEATATANGIPLPTPWSIDPDQNWDGVDGPWSSFTIGIGNPLQFVRVFVSTASQQTWAILPSGCYAAEGSDPSQAATNLQNCEDSRGWAYNYTESSSWFDIGIYLLYIEQNLGYYGNAQYGLDTVYLGAAGGNGPTEMNATVGATAGLFFYLGIFGVHPKPTNFTSFNDPYPSYMTLLKDSAQIPSLSFGYTAGAQYRYTGVLASLTLGGYDRSLFEENSVTFTFAPNNERDLVVGLQSITTDAAGQRDLLSEGIYVFIDSTVGQIWLPTAACEQFEQAFGLVYDNTSQLYLVNTTLHNQLLEMNPNVTFTIGQETSGGETIDIVLPYAAFDKTATPPFQNLSTSSLYFPLRRATQSNQYTFGRTFLQEAYLSVDWERQNFNVSQNIWRINPQKNIVTIPPTNTTALENNPGYLARTNTKSLLSGGAIAGIVVGAVIAIAIVAIIAFVLYRRKVKQRLAALQKKEDAADSNTGRSGSSSGETLHGQSMAQTGGTIVIPKAELDATVPPTFAKLVGEDYDLSQAGSGTFRPGSSTAGGSPMGTLIGAGSTLASPTGSQPPGTPGSPGVPRAVIHVGGLQEAENNEREIYEMPGDLPAPVEMPGPGQLDETAKEMDIAREREYNGVSPSERT